MKSKSNVDFVGERSNACGKSSRNFAVRPRYRAVQLSFTAYAVLAAVALGGCSPVSLIKDEKKAATGKEAYDHLAALDFQKPINDQRANLNQLRDADRSAATAAIDISKRELVRAALYEASDGKSLPPVADNVRLRLTSLVNTQSEKVWPAHAAVRDFQKNLTDWRAHRDQRRRFADDIATFGWQPPGCVELMSHFHARKLPDFPETLPDEARELPIPKNLRVTVPDDPPLLPAEALQNIVERREFAGLPAEIARLLTVLRVPKGPAYLVSKSDRDEYPANNIELEWRKDSPESLCYNEIKLKYENNENNNVYNPANEDNKLKEFSKCVANNYLTKDPRNIDKLKQLENSIDKLITYRQELRDRLWRDQKSESYYKVCSKEISNLARLSQKNETTKKENTSENEIEIPVPGKCSVDSKILELSNESKKPAFSLDGRLASKASVGLLSAGRPGTGVQLLTSMSRLNSQRPTTVRSILALNASEIERKSDANIAAENMYCSMLEFDKDRYLGRKAERQFNASERSLRSAQSQSSSIDRKAMNCEANDTDAKCAALWLKAKFDKVSKVNGVFGDEVIEEKKLKAVNYILDQLLLKDRVPTDEQNLGGIFDSDAATKAVIVARTIGILLKYLPELNHEINAPLISALILARNIAEVRLESARAITNLVVADEENIAEHLVALHLEATAYAQAYDSYCGKVNDSEADNFPFRPAFKFVSLPEESRKNPSCSFDDLFRSSPNGLYYKSIGEAILDRRSVDDVKRRALYDFVGLLSAANDEAFLRYELADIERTSLSYERALLGDMKSLREWRVVLVNATDRLKQFHDSGATPAQLGGLIAQVLQLLTSFGILSSIN